MPNVFPELEYALNRTILVGALPDANWAATLAAVPNDDTVAIRQHFSSKHGFGFGMVLRDVGGALVAPAAMTYTAQLYSVLNDGVADIYLAGQQLAGVLPYEAVVEDTVGFGRYAINVAAVAGIPVGVTEVEIYVREL